MLMYSGDAVGMKYNGAVVEWRSRGNPSNWRELFPRASSSITNLTGADRALRDNRQVTDGAVDLFKLLIFYLKKAFSCSGYTDWKVDTSFRASEHVGLQPIISRGCESESRRGHGCLSVVSVVYCQTGWSLICCECCLLSDWLITHLLWVLFVVRLADHSSVVSVVYCQTGWSLICCECCLLSDWLITHLLWVLFIVRLADHSSVVSVVYCQTGWSLICCECCL